jgi:hypothetical protein
LDAIVVRDPPLEAWSRAGALSAVTRLAAADDRELVPVMRRLTDDQRELVRRCLEVIDRLSGEAPPEAAG